MAAAPKTLAGAAKLAEKFAAHDGAIAELEERRTAMLASVNAEADAEAAPLLKLRDAAEARIVAWWNEAGRAIADGQGRKSIEIGGCMISERAGSVSLALAGEENAAVRALQAKDWGKDLLRVTVKLDRRKVLASLDGVYAKDLAKLGLSQDDGAATVSVKRTAQGGTIGGAA